MSATEKPDDGAQRYLRCPCGELIEAAGDAALIERARRHLAAAHPGREYTDDEILFLAF